MLLKAKEGCSKIWIMYYTKQIKEEKSYEHISYSKK